MYRKKDSIHVPILTVTLTVMYVSQYIMEWNKNACGKRLLFYLWLYKVT